MQSVVLYMHMHQPYRVKKYNIFSVGQDHDYWAEKDFYSGTNNERIFKKVAKKSYVPMLRLLKKCLERYPEFRFSLSITGTFVEQARAFAPEVLTLLQEVVATGRVEIAGETYYHSLAFFYDREEFAAQVSKHREMVVSLFGANAEPRVFRNTELAYNNDLAQWCEGAGYNGVLAEGWDKVLEGHSPNRVYRAEGCENLRILTKNYKLSDDIAFRFSNKKWAEWPLTADKYIGWLSESEGEAVNLFMDFETFGENIWEDTGIFGFFEEFVRKWAASRGDGAFLTLSESVEKASGAGSGSGADESLSMPWTVTWADKERDLSAWLGNSMQHEVMRNLYDLREEVLASGDDVLIADWRRLTTSDHPYYMSTKHLNDGGVHSYFSPYDSPFDAFLYFSNALRDIRARIEGARQ